MFVILDYITLYSIGSTNAKYIVTSHLGSELKGEARLYTSSDKSNQADEKNDKHNVM